MSRTSRRKKKNKPASSRWIVWTVVILVIIGVILGAAQYLPRKPAFTTADIAYRQAKLNHWIATAQGVAQKTGNSETIHVCDVVIPRLSFGLPTSRSVIPISPSDAHKPGALPFVLLRSQDKDLGEWTNYYTNSEKLGAAWLPDRKWLVICHDEAMTDDWAGIALLHEMSHIIQDDEGKLNDPRFRYYVEVPVNILEYQLKRSLGGKAYDDWIEKEVARLYRECRKKGYRIGYVLPGRKDDSPELDAIFGPPASDFERVYRAHSSWKHACFLLIDRYYTGNDKFDRKAAFLAGMGANEE